MHIGMHSMTALPFLVTGQYEAAIGCILPDIGWLHNEYAFRRSGYGNWRAWSIVQLTELMCMPYRITHSIPLVTAFCFAFDAWQLWIGCMLHIIIDLPTHDGVMRQRPFYPFTQWQWPWTIV